MKQIINHKSLNLYLNAAEELGFSYKILDKQKHIVQILDKDRQLIIRNCNLLGLNTARSKNVSINKPLTSQALAKNHIPVPAFSVFNNREEAVKYAINKLENNEHFVIKPSDSSCALGITINPSTKKQVLDALNEAFTVSDNIIIEETIIGNHYRITVLDNQIKAITQRIPGYVICDGIKPVLQLIKQKNTLRKKAGQPLIFLRNKDRSYLRSNHIKLSGVYKRGKRIVLQHGCDYDIGGERKRIDLQIVPLINQRMFINAVKTVNLRLAGIDFISNDITLPYTETHCAINEINCYPDPNVHFYDRFPYSNYAANNIIQRIFRHKTIKEQKTFKSYYSNEKTKSDVFYTTNCALIH